MLPALDDYAQAVICGRAQSLVGKYGLTISDQPDLEQELALAVLEHWPQFNPAKSSRRTFVYRVIQNKAVSLVRAQQCSKRGHGHRFSPLEKAEGYAAHERSGRLEGEQVQLALDTAQVISGLTPARQDLCIRLQGGSVAGAAKDLKISRAALYSRLRRIRTAFESAGMREYLYPT